MTSPLIRVSEDGRPRSTKNIHFYKSGDQSFTGVKMPVNFRKYRTLDALLDDLSLRVPGLSYGCRRIATPTGKHQITKLDQLQHLGNYVCSDKLSAKKVAGVDIAKLPGSGFDPGFRGQYITTPRPGEVSTFRSSPERSPIPRSRSQPPYSLQSTLEVSDKKMMGEPQSSPTKKVKRKKAKSKSKSPQKRAKSDPPKVAAGVRKKSRSPVKKAAAQRKPRVVDVGVGSAPVRGRKAVKVPPLALSKSESPPKRTRTVSRKPKAAKKKPPAAPPADRKAAKPPPRRKSSQDETGKAGKRTKKSPTKKKATAKKEEASPSPLETPRSPRRVPESSRRAANQRPASVESFGVSNSAPTTPSEKRRADTPLAPLDTAKLHHVQRRRILSRSIDADDYRLAQTPSPADRRQSRSTKPPSSRRSSRQPSAPLRDNWTEEESAAATKIQAGYRGYAVRKGNEKEKEQDAAAAKIQANVRGHQTHKKLKEEAAATKIQAGYRGYKVRKDLKEPAAATSLAPREMVREPTENLIDGEDEGTSLGNESPRASPSPPPPKATMDPDAAATKIQAQYRGYKTRKEYLKYQNGPKSTKSTGTRRRRKDELDLMSFAGSDEDVSPR